MLREVKKNEKEIPSCIFCGSRCQVEKVKGKNVCYKCIKEIDALEK